MNKSENYDHVAALLLKTRVQIEVIFNQTLINKIIIIVLFQVLKACFRENQPTQDYPKEEIQEKSKNYYRSSFPLPYSVQEHQNTVETLSYRHLVTTFGEFHEKLFCSHIKWSAK